MIVKALLAWAGLRAAPTFTGAITTMHSDAVHDALSIKTAILAGHARILRLQGAADLAVAAGDESLGVTIAEKQSDVRAGLDELARRLD